MGQQSGDRNGKSPHERQVEVVRRDKELKREVDEALEEWDRALEGEHPASPPPQSARAGRA
ncbi:MAG: hypothetical protein QOD65_1058 [Gaiellales bacterium]|jgi:CRISPR/Cas system-associated exonuclease Cas4 (RecB family)|nr:hypothetical protein [Gaiellales bacterium]